MFKSLYSEECMRNEIVLLTHLVLFVSELKVLCIGLLVLEDLLVELRLDFSLNRSTGHLLLFFFLSKYVMDFSTCQIYIITLFLYVTHFSFLIFENHLLFRRVRIL